MDYSVSDSPLEIIYCVQFQTIELVNTVQFVFQVKKEFCGKNNICYFYNKILVMVFLIDHQIADSGFVCDLKM